jgi:hypothetical protein
MTTTSILGKIVIPYGSNPQTHEINTAKFFSKLGFDVEFLIPNRSKDVRTPDIKMNGILWEIKSPIGESERTIKHSFKTALKQSKNIIFDLRRTKIPDIKCVKKLDREFLASKSIKRLLVILKSNKLLDLKK